MLLLPRHPLRWKPDPWPWTWSALAEPYASIAKSCVFLLPLWEESSTSTCLVTRTVLTRTSGTLTGAGLYGRHQYRTTEGANQFIGPSGFIPLTNPNAGYSIFGVASPVEGTTASAPGALFSLAKPTGPFFEYGLFFNLTQTGGVGGAANGQATAYHYADGSVAASNSSSVASAASLDGLWHAWGVTYSTAPKTTLWRDGLVRGTPATTTAPTLYNAEQLLYIGGLYNSGMGFVGGVGLSSAFNRALEDWEMKALHADPMGLLRPARRRNFYTITPVSSLTDVLPTDIADLKVKMPLDVPGGISAQDIHDFIDLVDARTTQTVLPQTGTTYTATLADNRRKITFNNASAITFTIPNNVPVGWECRILQLGAGAVTVVVTDGNLRHLQGHTTTAGQYAQAHLWCCRNAGMSPQIVFSGQTV